MCPLVLSSSFVEVVNLPPAWAAVQAGGTIKTLNDGGGRLHIRVA